MQRGASHGSQVGEWRVRNASRLIDDTEHENNVFVPCRSTLETMNQIIYGPDSLWLGYKLGDDPDIV